MPARSEPGGTVRANTSTVRRSPSGPSTGGRRIWTSSPAASRPWRAASRSRTTTLGRADGVGGQPAAGQIGAQCLRLRGKDEQRGVREAAAVRQRPQFHGVQAGQQQRQQRGGVLFPDEVGRRSQAVRVGRDRGRGRHREGILGVDGGVAGGHTPT
nr:hypothetical protein [Streptomyces sp. 846.5]